MYSKMERDYAKTGVSDVGKGQIFVNVDGRDGTMYRTINGTRSVIPKLTAYIDEVDIVEDEGNPDYEIEAGPAFILVVSATDPVDQRVKQFRLKVRSDYAFATPRFVNCLAGQLAKGLDNLVEISFYKKDDYRSLFCAISVNGEKDGKLPWIDGEGFKGAPRLDNGREEFVNFWTEMWKSHVMPVYGKTGESVSDTQSERKIFKDLKSQTQNTLKKVKSAEEIDEKWGKVLAHYSEKGLDETEIEILRNLWIVKLNSFKGYEDWTLDLEGNMKQEKHDDLPF